MDDRRPALDLTSMVVVPARPGPLVRLEDVERGRDEIDELLDDVFGEPDERGPGPVDGVLLIGGAAAAVAGSVTSLPTPFTVAGVIAFGLGAVLPLRSLSRRLGATRRARRLRSMIGDGALLRGDHAGIEQLLAAYQRLFEVSAALAPVPQRRVREVAHSAVLEVTSLLDGRRPGTVDEVGYVADRTRALDSLASAVRDPRVGDGGSERRRALVEAHRELEQLDGASSLTAAAELSRELLRSDGD